MSRFSNIPMGKGGFDVQPLPWPPVNLKFFAFPVTLCIFVYSQWRNMEKYVVSARKYRPTTFKSIVGQHALTKTLKNAVQTGRLAHSYLFCGQRGVGKTTTARIFAKAINCEHLTADGEPCNECESCRAFNEQRSLNIIEMDAASNNSVDEIRALTDQVLVPPITGRYRVFIIDEVHMLSQAAFNAFLKTLEEPPSYVIFILATTEKQKILPTILSRCQKYDFQSITPADIAEQLRYVADHEGYATEPAGLNVIAQKSDGAMRDALSIFDQVAAASGGNITYQAVIDNLNILDYDYYFRLTDAFLAGSVEQSLLIYKEVRDHGFEGKVFINGLANHFRELLVAHSPELAPLMEVTPDVEERYRGQSAKCKLQFIYSAMELCNKCDLSYRDATNKQFLVELTLIKICQLTGGSPSPEPQPGIKKIERTQQPAAQPQQAQAHQPVAPQPKASVAQQAVQQQKPAVQRPAAVPAASSSTATGGRKIAPLPKLHGSVANTAASVSEPVEAYNAAAARNTPYTYENLLDAWRSFVKDNPSEIILVNTIKSGEEPVEKSPGEYEFVVENEAQREMFEKKKAMLLSYLCGKLGNDGVRLQIKVREAGAREKLWTQKELLTDIIERNPKAKTFIDKYRLGFA